MRTERALQDARKCSARKSCQICKKMPTGRDLANWLARYQKQVSTEKKTKTHNDRHKEPDQAQTNFHFSRSLA
jgi:disulfide oxidoreductase YuzD